MIAAAVAIAVNAARKSGDDQISKIPDFLTEEEKADWKNKEVDKDQIFIYVNTNFTLQAGETEVPLRLVNPPYCAYPLKVVVLDTGRPDQPLYESEMTEPGESIENVDFENLPQDAGTYDLKIKYTYYDEKGESVVGEHEVGAKLELKE